MTLAVVTGCARNRTRGHTFVAMQFCNSAMHHETITTTALVLSIYEHLGLVEPRTVRQLVAVPGLASYGMCDGQTGKTAKLQDE